MRDSARVVIVGAGIVGASAAYHLTKLGWRDIIILDQGPLYETGGSTSHAPGILYGSNPSRLMHRMAHYTSSLYAGLAYEDEPVWYGVGSLEVAMTDDRLAELWRRHAQGIACETEVHILSGHETRELVPMIDPTVLKGALYRPSDGVAKSWKAAGAMAIQAIETGGAAFYGETTVTDFELHGGRITAVVTDKGRIECEQALLCTNIWGSVLADKLDIGLPMMACAHPYAITEPLPELAGETSWISQPSVRHQGCAMYFRQWDTSWCTGAYCHAPRIVSPYDIGRDAFNDWLDEDFVDATQDAIELFPCLQGREYSTRVNGMFVFSVDGFPMMGPTAVPGFWTAIGIWVTHAGGAGKCIAEWMVSGHAEWDMREANVNRFHPHQVTPDYVRTRVTQNYVEVYDIVHPRQQMSAPRNLRAAPFHDRLEKADAHFFSASGWETAQWYESNAGLMNGFGDRIPERSGWEAVGWSPLQGAEHLAVRETGGLFSLANFTKLQIGGAGAMPFLDRIAANNMDMPVGKIVYTTLLNDAGGILADVTVTRLGEDRYWLMTGSGSGPQEIAWIRSHLPADGSVVLQDLTAEYTAIGLWGPSSRAVLDTLVSDDISNSAFPYFSAQELQIGEVSATALRLSYAGELGWEIYCSDGQGLMLWDCLWAAGREHGLVAAGAGCMGSLRLEKGYRAIGADIHTEANPYEAGLGWAVCMDKGDFIGREALEEANSRGVRQKLCCMSFDEPNGMALGGEPILRVSGDRVGYVTSADYGYSVGRFVIYGYLAIDCSQPGTRLQIQYFDRRSMATVTDEPLFDPHSIRLKC